MKPGKGKGKDKNPGGRKRNSKKDHHGSAMKKQWHKKKDKKVNKVNPVVNQYIKNLKKEKSQQLEASSRVDKIYREAGEAVHRSKLRTERQKLKLPTFHKEEKKWKMKQAEKNKKQELAAAKKEALEKYSKQKTENHKKLAKRNYKGQPNMASQMDLLLQKIKNLD